MAKRGAIELVYCDPLRESGATIEAVILHCAEEGIGLDVERREKDFGLFRLAVESGYVLDAAGVRGSGFCIRWTVCFNVGDTGLWIILC